MDPLVSHRIAVLRFVMIAGIVLLHTQPFVSVTDIAPNAFAQMKAFFQNAFFRGAVPVLTFISGYLLFMSNADRDYRELLVKKARVLLVPFIVFNGGLLLLVSVVNVGVDVGSLEWADALLGLTASPVNYPLNFLRDLMAVMLIVPILSACLRSQALLCLPGIVLFFMFDYDGQFILRNDMPILFYLGGMAAVGNWKMDALDFMALPLFGLFCALCALWVELKIENTNVLRFCAPLMLWPAASLIAGTKLSLQLDRLSKYSFFIFLAHAPVLALTWKLKPESMPYFLYWIAAPVFTIASLIMVYKFAMRVAPRLFSVMIGCKAPKARAVLATA